MIRYKRDGRVRCWTLKDIPAGQEGYGVTLFTDQLVVFRHERRPESDGGGWCTWYPFRFLWWPRKWNYDGLRNLGWVTRKHWGDDGKKPWESMRRKRLYAQAVKDFRTAVEDINKLPPGSGRYQTYQRMRDAAQRQGKYTRYPRR